MLPAESTAIAIRGLSKRYGSTIAVKNLDLDVRSGEIFGFIGLNGAGKTTTIRILLDLLRPTSGQVLIFGHDCQRGLEARSMVGYLPGEMGMYSDMTGSDLLDFLSDMSGRNVSPAYRRELEERFELPPRDLRRKLREYSTGLKRKLGLIQSFQSDPPLLILDEPTEGLDPLMQEAFYGLLASVKAKGRTVFMSSHVLSEVERVCDRIALLRNGELVLLSTVEEARKLAARRVRIWFHQDTESISLPPGHTLVNAQPRQWTLQVEGELGPLLQRIQSLSVKDIAVDEPKLEDVLVKYYRDGAA